MCSKIVNVNVFVLILILLISACSNQIDNAGDDFKVSLDKWEALTRFSESFLEKTSMKVVVSINNNSGVNNGFKLSGFRLSLSESASEINLLRPNITSKYLCNVNCVYLSELVRLKNKELDVISNIYFETNEFEFFDFYSKLYLLNVKVEKYTKVNEPLFLRYLEWLSLNSPPINDINLFIAYLEQVFEEKSFLDFVNDPSKRFVSIDNFPQENKSWTHSDLLLNNEWSDEVTSWDSSPPPTMPWDSRPPPAMPWDSSPPPAMPWENNSFSDIEMAIGQNTPIKVQQPSFIDISDVVCIGEFNQFGIVTQIIGNNIEVEIRGELRVFTNGVLSRADANSILKLSGKIYFIDINKTQLFSRAELVKCDVY
tara:strand:- start:47601 stop:48707 length:1107 start_codon:yes stop_codon:yes gene_type:complete